MVLSAATGPTGRLAVSADIPRNISESAKIATQVTGRTIFKKIAGFAACTVLVGSSETI